MRLKKISNKAIAYACVGTLAVSSLAGVNLASVKAAEDSKTEAEINAYKEVSVPWMAKEYDPGTDGDYKYLAGIDLADLNVTKDYQYLQLSYTGESTSFDELRFEVVGTDKGLGTFWFKENPQGTIKTVDDTLVANPTETEQTVVIDLAKSGITNAEGIATIHMHDTKGKGAFTITDAQFTNTPLQVAKTPVEPEETTPEETTPDNNGETTPETTTEKVIADGTNDIIL